MLNRRRIALRDAVENCTHPCVRSCPPFSPRFVKLTIDRPPTHITHTHTLMHSRRRARRVSVPRRCRGSAPHCTTRGAPPLPGRGLTAQRGRLTWIAMRPQLAQLAAPLSGSPSSPAPPQTTGGHGPDSPESRRTRGSARAGQLDRSLRRMSRARDVAARSVRRQGRVPRRTASGSLATVPPLPGDDIPLPLHISLTPRSLARMCPNCGVLDGVHTPLTARSRRARNAAAYRTARVPFRSGGAAVSPLPPHHDCR